MYCEKCGSEIKEGEKFCNNCGNPINQNEEISENTSSTLTSVNTLNNNNNENSNVETEKKISEKNTKNKNSSNIIIVLIVLIILGVGIYYFLTKDNGNNDNEINDDKTNVEDKNDKDDNKNDNVVDNNDDKDNSANNNDNNIVDNNSSDDVTKYDFKFNNNYGFKDITLEINKNKELEVYYTDCTQNCEKGKINLNGEKVKEFVVGTSWLDSAYTVYALTNNGNIYSIGYDHLASQSIVFQPASDFTKYENYYKKIDSKYYFTDIVSSSNLYYLEKCGFVGGCTSKSNESFIALTKTGEYVDIASNFIIDSPIAIGGLQFNYFNSYYYNYSLIYKDGSINYFNNKENYDKYISCLNSSTNNSSKYNDCSNPIIESKNYIYDENNNIIKSQFLMVDKNDTLTIITKDNYVYKFNGEKQNNNYIAKKDGDIKVNNIEINKNDYGVIQNVNIDYSNGTKDNYSILKDYISAYKFE